MLVLLRSILIPHFVHHSATVSIRLCRFSAEGLSKLCHQRIIRSTVYIPHAVAIGGNSRPAYAGSNGPGPMVPTLFWGF